MKCRCATIMIILILQIFSWHMLFAQNYYHYFPLQTQNNWQYRYEEAESIYALPDSVFGTTTINDTLYSAWGDKKEHPILLHQDKKGRIYRRLADKHLLWFDFTQSNGAQYIWAPHGADNQFIVTVRKNISITTYAGKYDDCIEFFFDDPDSFDDEQWYVFAPNVGIVKKQFASVTCLLASAHVDGKTITRVKQTTTNIVSGYRLCQNYPNPFNSATFIKFALPSETSLRLDIYNVRGHKVRSLVSSRQSPGEYIVMWDGTDDFSKPLQSGIYTYQLLADDFLDVKRLVLLR